MGMQELETSALALKQGTLELWYFTQLTYYCYEKWVTTKVLTWSHAGSHFDSDVSCILHFALPITIQYFLLLVCFLPLIVHFNKRILCYFKLEGTSGQFPCCVFYQKAQNLDAVFWMDASECWVKGDNNFPQSTGYAPVTKAQITSAK